MRRKDYTIGLGRCGCADGTDAFIDPFAFFIFFIDPSLSFFFGYTYTKTDEEFPSGWLYSMLFDALQTAQQWLFSI